MIKVPKQAYAIVRVDAFQEADVSLRNRITVKKVVWNERLARNETDRLNELNKDKGCLYFWQATRIDQAIDRP
jgi:hypothetical protein